MRRSLACSEPRSGAVSAGRLRELPRDRGPYGDPVKRISYDKKITRAAMSERDGLIRYIFRGEKWYLRAGHSHKVNANTGAVQWWTGKGWRNCRVAV